MKFERARVTDPKYIMSLRDDACVFTGQRGSENESVVPMHVGTYGKGLKSDDEAWPALNRFHQFGHQSGEVSMIREHAPDWLIREMARAWCREQYRQWKATNK